MANINPNTTSTRTQTDMIRRALLNGERLTPLDALHRFGCFRLGARIWDLSNKFQMNIRKEMVDLPNGKKVAAYSLNA